MLSGGAGRPGRLRMRLDAVEVSVLATLLAELAQDLAQPDGDPALRRLFPAAYRDDDTAAAEFRSLTETGLRDARQERISAAQAELAGGPDVRTPGGALVMLDAPDAADRWLMLLNDLRLTLGTRLGVTEDEVAVDLSDPAQQPRLTYHWLTAVQDSLVHALMR